MIPLSEIIGQMTKEERAKFASFLRKRGKQTDSKKLTLLKLISDKKVVVNQIPVKIYGTDNRVAYHQLRKRLFNELIDFISTERFNQEEEEILQITKLILAGKHLIETKNYKSGFKLLSNAEKKAIEENDVISLNEIYNLLIQFSHYNAELDLDNAIKSLESNRVQLIQESNLNMAYAMVKSKLDEFILNGIDVDIETLLFEVFERFNITESSGNNYKTLYQLVQIVSASANINKDYEPIIPFVTARYNIISRKEEEKNRHVFFHFKLLYFMANIFFREKKFERSNFYLDKMVSLLETNKKYKKLFETKIKVLKSLNTNYLGENQKASELIEKVIGAKFNHKNKDYLDAMIVCSMIYFHQKEFKKVQTMLSKLRSSDTYYTKLMGANWVMNKNLIEILTHIELENLDYVDSRLDSFLRINKDYLKQDNRATVFLKFLKVSYTQPEKLKTPEFEEGFYNSVEVKPRLREDIYIMSFFAYLKAKMLGTDTYETTLELVRGIS